MSKASIRKLFATPPPTIPDNLFLTEETSVYVPKEVQKRKHDDDTQTPLENKKLRMLDQPDKAVASSSSNGNVASPSCGLENVPPTADDDTRRVSTRSNVAVVSSNSSLILNGSLNLSSNSPKTRPNIALPPRKNTKRKESETPSRITKKLKLVLNNTHTAVNKALAHSHPARTNKPSNTVTNTSSSATNKSSTIATTNKPPAVATTNKPSVIATTSKPPAIASTSKPSAVATNTSPSDIVATNKSSPIVTNTSPSDIVATNKSSPIVTNTSPSAPAQGGEIIPLIDSILATVKKEAEANKSAVLPYPAGSPIALPISSASYHSTSPSRSRSSPRIQPGSPPYYLPDPNSVSTAAVALPPPLTSTTAQSTKRKHSKKEKKKLAKQRKRNKQLEKASNATNNHVDKQKIINEDSLDFDALLEQHEAATKRSQSAKKHQKQ